MSDQLDESAEPSSNPRRADFDYLIGYTLPVVTPQDGQSRRRLPIAAIYIGVSVLAALAGWFFIQAVNADRGGSVLAALLGAALLSISAPGAIILAAAAGVDRFNLRGRWIVPAMVIAYVVLFLAVAARCLAYIWDIVVGTIT